MNVRINGTEVNVSTAYLIVALATGQKLTNSGKSYAMPAEEHGVIYESAERILEISKTHPNATVLITAEDWTAKFAFGNLAEIAEIRRHVIELSERRRLYNDDLDKLLEVRKDSTKAAKSAKTIDTAEVADNLEAIFA